MLQSHQWALKMTNVSKVRLKDCSRQWQQVVLTGWMQGVLLVFLYTVQVAYGKFILGNFRSGYLFSI